MKINLNRMFTVASPVGVVTASLLLAVSSTWGATAPMPQIDSAVITSPTVLQIDGSGFGTVRPTVVLGGTPLYLLSFTDTVVVASVPVAVPAGSYTLVITQGSGKDISASFDVTIGAAGPAGATGPAGPAGPTGPAGPVGTAGVTGPAGLQGLAGPTGPAGVQGLTGTPGPSGPAGPQGFTGPQGPAGLAGAMGLPGASHVYTGVLDASTQCNSVGCFCPRAVPTCLSPTLPVPAGVYLVQGSVNLYNPGIGEYQCSVVDQAGDMVGAITAGSGPGYINLSVLGSSSTATGFAVLCNSVLGTYAMTANVAAIQVGGIN
jgi:hypothetical protein